MERASYILLNFLVNSAWQIAAILAITSLCSLLLRRAPSRYVHTLWIVALALCAILPIWSLLHITGGHAASGDRQKDVGVELRVTVSGTGQFARSAPLLGRLARPTVAPGVAYTIAACYLAFLLYRFAFIAIAWRHTRRLRRMPTQLVTTGRLHALVERCSSVFGLRRTPTIYITDSLGPVTAGVLRPILLVPATLAESAAEPELLSAVSHELAHIRRHDFAINLATEIMSLPVSFHPGVAFIKSRVETTRELACDDAAAEKLNSRAVYARSLLSISTSLRGSAPAPDYGQGLFDTARMEERIMNLTSHSGPLNSSWGRVFAVICPAILTTCSLGAAAFSIQIARPAPLSTVSGAARAALETPAGYPVAQQHAPAEDKNTTKMQAHNLSAVSSGQRAAIVNSNRTVPLASSVDEFAPPSVVPNSSAAQLNDDEDFPDYYKIGPGITPPRATYSPDPQYDPESRAAHVEGEAIFHIAVGSDGTVKDVRLKKSSLPAALIGNAEKTLRRWTFEPARRNGEAIPVQLNVMINFRLY